MRTLHYDFELRGAELHRAANDGGPRSQTRIQCGDVERLLAREFSSDLRDLVRTAAAVHEADRLAARKMKGCKDVERELRWQRSIALTIDVEDQDRWRAATATLTDLLAFLTDDAWSLNFVQAREAFQPQRPLDLDLTRKFDEVALFSGGLDSAAGFLARNARKPATYLGIGVGGSGTKRRLLKRVASSLRAAGIDFEYLHFWLQLDQAAGKVHENSQRSRGFLFLALGVAVARAVGQRAVCTYEAGPGALDLRLNEAQVGAQNTRSMHPHAFELFDQLLTEVLDEPMVVEAPFLWHTKGETCRLAGAELLSIVEDACSCDRGEARRPSKDNHCGNCTSCLLRRSALHAVLGKNDPTNYGAPEAGPGAPYMRRVFEEAAWRLRSARTFHDLVMIDPTILDAERYFMNRGQPREEVRALLPGLLQRHADEVLSWCADMPVAPGVAT